MSALVMDDVETDQSVEAYPYSFPFTRNVFR